MFKGFCFKVFRTPVYIVFVSATKMLFVGIIAAFGRVAFMNSNTLAVVIDFYSSVSRLYDGMMPYLTIVNAVIAFVW